MIHLNLGALPKSPIGFPKSLAHYFIVHDLNNFVIFIFCGQKQYKKKDYPILCYTMLY